MIKAHQPTIFGSHVAAYLSSVSDGNMRMGVGDSDEVVAENRRKFLSPLMIAMQASVLCGVTYDRDDFTQYVAVDSQDKGKGMMPGTEVIIADALATDEKGIALFLPLADCPAAIIYDPARTPRLMVAHLGRHSCEQYGAVKCIEFMHDKYGSRPEDLLVWVSPSPNGQDFPIWKRDNKSFREVLLEDFQAAGVTRDHIEMSEVDTVTRPDYFSYSEFLKGNRPTAGRYAVVAKLR